MWKVAIDLLVKLLAWMTRRPILNVRIIKDDPDVEIGNLLFEVENVSDTVTSLDPTIYSTFWHPQHGKYNKGNAIYDVRELDRKLPPYQAKIYTGTARTLPNGYGFSWFRAFSFRPTRGLKTIVYVRNASLKPLDWLHYKIELIRFRTTRKVINTGPMSMKEYESMKRSRGPH